MKQSKLSLEPDADDRPSKQRGGRPPHFGSITGTPILPEDYSNTPQARDIDVQAYAEAFQAFQKMAPIRLAMYAKALQHVKEGLAPATVEQLRTGAY